MKKHLKSMLAIMIAAFTFASCADVPSPYGLFFSDKGELDGAVGTGTADDPYNVAGAINFVRSLDPNVPTTNYVFIKGIVSRLVDGQNYDAGFGNGTFYISDDGNTKNEFYVFRALYFGSIPYTGGPIANIGDEVIICAKVINYNGNTPETVEKDGYLYSLNGATSYDMPEFGTKEAPLSVADAIDIINKLENKETAGFGYVKGKVSKVGDLTASSGKLTYYISDDGSNSKTIQVYMGLGLEKGKFKATTDLTIGDEVVVYGPLYKYANSSGAITPEINEGNYLISLNKGSGPYTPTETIGTKENPKTVAEALTLINALSDGGKSDLQAYVKGKVVKVTTSADNFTKYGNLVYLISADGTENNTITVYSGDGLNGDKFKGINDLSAGDEVIVLGYLYKYFNKSGAMTPEIDSGNYLVYLKKADGSGEQGGGGSEQSGGGGTISGNTISVTVASDLNVSDTKLVEEQTIADGTKLSFAQNGNSSGPKYYNSGKDIRFYPKNSLTITASKKISKIVLSCSIYNGTNCVAEGNISPTATVDGTTVTFNNINANSVTITNNHTGTGPASQLRVQNMVITYAQ